jgi:hypothetical protein
VFQISREVIESIQRARESQLQQIPPGKYNLADLAKIRIVNGEVRDFVIEYKKLLKWVSTFNSEEVKDIRAEISIQRELRDIKSRPHLQKNSVNDCLVFNIGSSQIAFANRSDLPTPKETIEITISNDIAQPVETLTKDQLKAIKKDNLKKRNIDRINKDILTIGYLIKDNRKTGELQQDKVIESLFYLQSHSISEAIDSSRARLERARQIRRIKRRLERNENPKTDLLRLDIIDPWEEEKFDEEGNFISWPAIKTFDSLYDKWKLARDRQESYKPRKFYSNAATKERKKRASATKDAKRAFDNFIYSQLNLWASRLETEISYYQFNRKQVRSWPKLRASIQAEIESLELDLRTKQQELSNLGGSNV